MPATLLWALLATAAASAPLPGEVEHRQHLDAVAAVAAAADVRLLEWIEGEGGRVSGVSIELGPYGRQVVAKAPMAEGEELFFVPSTCIMTGPMLRYIDPPLDAALRQFRPDLDGGTIMVPGLVRQDMMGPESRFAPYLGALPRENSAIPGADITEVFLVYHPLDLAEEILGGGEAPSSMMGVRRCYNDYLGIVGNMMDLARQAPELFPDVSEDDLWSALTWSYIIQLSRTWDLIDGVGPGFVPLADLVNHRDGAPAVNTAGDGVALLAAADTPTGGEVFDRYFSAERCAENAFMSFGFVPLDNGCVQFTVSHPNGSEVQVVMNEGGVGALPTAVLADMQDPSWPEWRREAEGLRLLRAGLSQYEEATPVEEDERWLAARWDALKPVERSLWQLRIVEKKTARVLIRRVEAEWMSLLHPTLSST